MLKISHDDILIIHGIKCMNFTRYLYIMERFWFKNLGKHHTAKGYWVQGLTFFIQLQVSSKSCSKLPRPSVVFAASSLPPTVCLSLDFVLFVQLLCLFRHWVNISWPSSGRSVSARDVCGGYVVTSHHEYCIKVFFTNRANWQTSVCLSLSHSLFLFVC